MTPTTIIKRDGSIVPFDPSKIERAIERARPETYSPETLACRVLAQIENAQPTVEDVQDLAESALQSMGEFEAAKRYILYRARKAEERKRRPIPAKVKAAFDSAAAYFPTTLQQFQFFDKYSRFNYELGRRETWVETVDRAVDYLRELSGDQLPAETYAEIRAAVLAMEVMPSMRLLAMAGPAARRNNVAIYNCSYMPVDSIDSFVEALIISMAGCGVGFSVEQQYVDRLPYVRRQMGYAYTKAYTIEDSAEGWADALRHGLECWVGGLQTRFDYSQIRPAGAPLRVKGGRASGPEPLRKMLDFVRERVLARQGGFLTSLDAHDIMCAVGNAAVSGGVRRTAMISLFSTGDDAMLHCKDGDFERDNSQRWNANNSMVWDATPDRAAFDAQFDAMVASGRGEPGIFSRIAAIRDAQRIGRKAAEFGCNPCGEIVLRPRQFCNLSAVVARADDTYATLARKVRIATIIGTIQSMATHFHGLRPEWRRNCEEERLLGVDITGQMDCPVVQDAETMTMLRYLATLVNVETAATLVINPAAAITCVKPSGNSSQLLNCSSGLHARWAPYYVRNVRVAATSPLFKVLRDAGVPMDPENGQTPEDANTWVIHFPVKSPEGAITRNGRSAIEQCEHWLMNKQHWTDHNPSVTITYQPHEVEALKAWAYAHRERIGGMAFLPSFDASYAQMPYEEIDADTYERLSAAFPPVDFAKIWRYEEQDLTTAAQELACSSGSCEIDLI